ncbi:MAG TPA: Calx-beta domain-containing protein, partial [Pyrinomonadaceae bacterium]|nr:Calx-beta domain-containing protein [Pyrinomonadaceae bacterium]
MKEFSPRVAHRASRTALSALFTVALLVGGLVPLASHVQAKSQPKARGRGRAAADVKRGAKARRGGRRVVRAEAERDERFDEPSAGEEAEGEGDVQKREEWFNFKRRYPFNEVPPEARRVAWESRPKGGLKGGEGRAVRSAAAFQWQPIGPAPTTPKFPNNWGMTSGRINAIAIKPDDPNVILVGASTGGIWRSTDAGATFAAASDSQVDLAVGSIAFAPGNPQRVYAGMGDLWGGYLGTGVLRSDDGGATWARASDGTLPSYGQVNNVRVDPNDPNRVYATLYQYYNGNSSGTFDVGGFYVSTNGGVTWQKPLAGLARDVAISPANPQTIYAGMRRVDSNVDGVNLPGLYKSTNGGQTWARVYTSSFGAYTGSTRIDMRVAVTPAAPQKVYILSGNTIGSSPSPVLAVSDDEGQTWGTNLPVTGIDPGQYFYNIHMFADPTNAATLYVGTRDVFKSTNGGSSWQSITKNYCKTGANWNYAPTGSSTCPGGSTSHPDQHSFAFSPADPNTIYVGNDGGISKSTNGGATFQSLNASLALTQFVGIAAHPANPDFTIAGAQDNGTQVRAAGGNSWTEFAEGDGGHPVISAADPSVVFSTYVFGAIRWWRFNADGTRTELFSRRTSETTFGESTSNPRIAFYPPFTGNGVDGAVYFGTWKLFVSTNYYDQSQVPVWTPLGPGGGADLTNGGSDVLNAIGAARTGYSPSQVIYTGSAQGRAKVTQDGGATWADVTAGLPNRSIESITVDPANAATAYLTVSGFGSGHVFKTTNFGASWADLSGSDPATKLPNVPTTAFIIDPADPNVVYAGTDIGVFRSTTSGGAWETFNTGMPPVPVSGFTVSASGKIQVATYGRGAYELQSVAALASLQFELQVAPVGEATPRAVLNVTRTGDLSTTVSATVRTQDNPAAVRCDDTSTQPFVAFARCDYATTVETLTFAAGETKKSFSVSIINDVFQEPDENILIILVNPSAGAQIGPQGGMTLRIVSDDATTPPASANPILRSDFFVRQQYLDFFGREPDAAGFQAWKATLDNCPDPFNTSPTSASANCDRVSVSTKFFRSQEFELKGRFVFNFYKAALGRLPRYSEIIPDMAGLTAVDDAGFFAKKAAFTNEFVQRQEFKSLYDGLSNQQFVNTLMGRYNLQQITT